MELMLGSKLWGIPQTYDIISDSIIVINFIFTRRNTNYSNLILQDIIYVYKVVFIKLAIYE